MKSKSADTPPKARSTPEDKTSEDSALVSDQAAEEQAFAQLPDGVASLDAYRKRRAAKTKK